ncbi:carbohydrate-binding module family 1 protein [Neurospora crassa]|uniref:lytic cellulose monooxygenase (C4-dehydrogenating) n=1 Tax=Neurospora crassa (strain ATCC 24698 / 74-OR23-1A / CBS 708.71 / DSM 1257 / FGSC 987) TaxID=367110 RepID=Q7S111_NEUCR|nr:endoglucanase IV [Neurospora crassa OR74A]EAA29018.1 endoglucanase IV [Neurospora crassa OR74A]KHE85031.1 carbohydrate-binding module family 1 protein [Neurospora crassa]|eukprot:XP_958254.1 endoglucanase IV [Neurospora crassa OR74A]
MARMSILTALAGASLVAAHGHVSKVIVNGVEYQNYDPTSFPYNSNPPTVIGWTIDQKDNGFVSPDAFDSGDIICHKSAKPAGGHATVKAGDKISLQWDQWPESHKGPVIDYLAACDGDCESVDKTALKFFKIDGAGYDATNGWASDTLIKDGNSWVVEIPESIKPGNYVLRHEIIALHSAGQANGAQNYPQCFNLKVEGSGSTVPAGVAGTELYKATDAGILFDIYKNDISYPVPGPSLIAGASSSIAQSKMAATATASATLPGATGGSNSPATSAAAAAPATSAAAATSQVQAAPATTLVTSTKAAAPATSAAAPAAPATSAAAGGAGQVQAKQTKWGQCGGNGFTGPTECESGSTCTKYNDWYSQCV